MDKPLELFTIVFQKKWYLEYSICSIDYSYLLYVLNVQIQTVNVFSQKKIKIIASLTPSASFIIV
jgi:hypothetical protein